VTPIEQWAAEMEFAGKAPATIACRSRALRLLTKQVGDPLALTKSELVGWLAQRPHPSTRSTLLAYLRSFYQWAVREGLVVADPTERIAPIKVPSADPRPAPVEDIGAALGKANPRTRSMILLMAYCGLRSCEVAGVRPEHFHRATDGRWTLEIPRSKGGHRQTVKVPAWVAEAVTAGPTWAVTAQTVQKSVRDAFKEADSPITPHQLRHYFGTSMLHTTDNFRVVQEAMRHASPATTARYTKVESSELSDAVEALPVITWA
jgi:integrase